MNDLVPDTALIAACGLYCGACRRHLAGKCAGCRANDGATWCKVRTCVLERGLSSCADCHDFARPKDCKKVDNPIAKVIGLLLNSNREACLLKIRELGPAGYASFMAQRRRQTLPRRGAVE
jgi:hypothetical protein